MNPRRLVELTAKVAEAAGGYCRSTVDEWGKLRGRWEVRCSRRIWNRKRIQGFFGDKWNVKRWRDLVNVAEKGVPIAVKQGGDLQREVAYGNHRSVEKHEAEVFRKAMLDVALGRAMVFKVEEAGCIDGIRISPVGVVEEKEKIRVIHDLTFEGPSKGCGGKPMRSVNADTDWGQVPGCELGGVLDAILKRVLGLRAKFGVRARILIQKMDVKSAFRQVTVDPDGASCFAYRLGKFVFVDFRLQFGWRGSPGWWGLVAGAIQEAQRNMKMGMAVESPAAAAAATEGVYVAGRTEQRDN